MVVNIYPQCDPNATLTGAFSLSKPPKSTTRAAVLIDKQGILQVYFAGGPQKTLDAVLEYINSGKGGRQAAAAAAEAQPKAAEASVGKGGGGDAGGEVTTEKGLDKSWLDTTRKMDEVPLIRTPSKEEAEAAETAAEVSEVAARLDALAEEQEQGRA